MKLATITDHNYPQLRYVPLDELKIEWPGARGYIMAAAEQAAEMTEEEIIGKIAACNLHLFAIYNNDECVGAATIALDIYPARTVATIVHAGGDLKLMIPLFPEFEVWAKAMGASALRLNGRRGWRKRPPPGFKEIRVTMEKEL